MIESKLEKVIFHFIIFSKDTSKNDMLKIIITFRLSRICNFLNNIIKISAQKYPINIPNKIEVGTFKKTDGEKLPLDANPKKEVNKVITYISSTEAPVIIS